MATVLDHSKGSYPGGKSGSGIYQRLINLIPPHRVLIVPFAGHCGVTRNIRPAEHTIVIDRDPNVCEWWANWRRSKHGRDLEIHICDGIEWLRFRLGVTEYSDAAAGVAAGFDASRNVTADGRPTDQKLAQAFILGDPPYVLSERSTGKIYECELSDADHLRLLEILTSIDASRYRILLCGYASELYRPLNHWQSIDHRVPTRGGLQDERIWMNYQRPAELHDYRYLGNCRRTRERIRRRQSNWRKQLNSMSLQERMAMLEVLNGGSK